MSSKVGWARHQGITWVRQHRGRLMVSGMVPACWLCAGRAHQRNMVSASTSVLEKAATAALVLMLDNLVSSCMSLVPFKLLSQPWGLEDVRLSKSMHRPFTRNCLGLQQPPSSWVSISVVFTTNSYGNFSFCPWNPGMGGLVWGWDLAPQGRRLQRRYPFWFLFAACGFGTSQFHISAPPTSLHVASSPISWL